MDQPLMTVNRRAIRNFGLTGAGGSLVVALIYFYDTSLRDAAFLDGWLLAVGMLVLTLYNLRKKMPALPLLSAATWLQIHVHVGTLCAVLFLIHTEFRLPNGLLETVMWIVFVLVVASGAIGLFLSRQLPARINARGERVIFERIPGLQSKLAAEARNLAVRAAQESGSRATADFYDKRLHAYLSTSGNFWSHLMGSDAPLRRHRAEIKDMHRYQDANGRAILNELDAIVVAKDNLEHQHALQFALKIWLFAHIPLTYGILLLSAVHVVLVYAFASGAS
jgi:hypothetical protein